MGGFLSRVWFGCCLDLVFWLRFDFCVLDLIDLVAAVLVVGCGILVCVVD